MKGISFLRSAFTKLRFGLIFTNPVVYPVLAFLVPLVVRAIPEILSGQYPVGFDVFAYYVPTTLSWLRDGVGFWNMLATAPLLYILLMGITSTGTPIFWTLKILAPSLLGLLGFAVFFYAHKTLEWSPRKSLLAVFFATLYFVVLRISWDMLRSELAIIFLFTALILLGKEGKVDSWKKWGLLSLSLALAVLSNQLVAAIGLFIVLALIVRFSLDKRLLHVRNLFVTAAPALFLFLLIVYANYVVSPTFSVLTNFPAKSVSGFFALFGFSSYSGMIFDTIGFAIFCYLPLLPLLALGVKRFEWNVPVSAWVGWICLALLLSFVSPNASFIVLPYRWVLLLSFPLAFLAADAVAKIQSNTAKKGVFIVLAILSASYFLLPTNIAFPYFNMYSNYVPTSMAATTIPIQDSQDTLNALAWAKSNMDNESKLLVHEIFYSWAFLNLDEQRIVSYGYDDPSVCATNILKDNPGGILYLIWWIRENSWFGAEILQPCFYEVFRSGQIAVYEYDANVA